MIRLRGNQAQYPPKPLNLFFALYMNTKSQMMSNVENEQRILGRAMQVRICRHRQMEATNFRQELIIMSSPVPGINLSKEALP